MPRSNMLILECNFCGNKDSFDQNVPVSMGTEKVHKWRQVQSLDDPAIQGVDNSRWYDSIDCMVSGEKRHEKRFADTHKAATAMGKGMVHPEAALPPLAEVVKQDS
jgi:hypothetical protein